MTWMISAGIGSTFRLCSLGRGVLVALIANEVAYMAEIRLDTNPGNTRNEKSLCHHRSIDFC